MDNSAPNDVASDKDAGLGTIYNVIAGNDCVLNVLHFLIIFLKVYVLSASGK
jgi:hypothetical protein